MAKETHEYTIRDFCKFVLKNWIILIACLVLGGLVAVYSYKHQSANYTSSAIILVHDNEYEYNGTISPYVQIASILKSKEAFEDAGINVGDTAFGDVLVNEKATGVFEITDSNPTEAKALSDLNMIVENSEKVIAKTYNDEKQYHVAVLKKPGEPVADVTTKDKILSFAVIMAAFVFLAIAIDFIAFSKKAS